MNPRTLLLGAVLGLFGAFSAAVAFEHSYFGVFASVLDSSASLQIFLDLAIALTLVNVWLVRDARERGISAWPWVVATMALGSLAPLTYLLIRSASPAPAASPSPQPR